MANLELRGTCFLAQIHACYRDGRIAPSHSSVFETLNVCLPLGLVGSQDATVVRQKPVHLSLHVGGLRPYATATCEQANLVSKLGEEGVAAVIPGFGRLINLVRLVDGVDRCLNIPQTGKRTG